MITSLNRLNNRLNRSSSTLGVVAGCLLAAVTAQAAVETSGKQAVELGAIPQEILQLVTAHSPGFLPGEAESETRNGQVYYDIEGETAAGDELEFDITQVDGQWTIVETQRDIAWEVVPAPVQDSLKSAAPEFMLRRIIESDQGDGVIIYEFFGSEDGAGDGAEETKLEVRFADGAAEMLAEEWVH